MLPHFNWVPGKLEPPLRLWKVRIRVRCFAALALRILLSDLLWEKLELAEDVAGRLFLLDRNPELPVVIEFDLAHLLFNFFIDFGMEIYLIF